MSAKMCSRCSREFLVGPNPFLSTNVESESRPGYCVGCEIPLAINEAIERGDFRLEPLESFRCEDFEHPLDLRRCILDGIFVRRDPPCSEPDAGVS